VTVTNGARDGGGGGDGAGHRARTAEDNAVQQVVFRGVRWRRSPSGRVAWYNEGLGRWVKWSPGSDAPPTPEGWAATTPKPEPTAPATIAVARERSGLLRYLPTDAMARRPGLRSPFRVVPIAIALLIVVLALYQATAPATKASKQDIAAAEALKGHCLARSGGDASALTYSSAPLSCTAAGAVVKVVAVLVPGAKESACPKGSALAELLDVGVVGEPLECLEPLRR